MVLAEIDACTAKKEEAVARDDRWGPKNCYTRPAVLGWALPTHAQIAGAHGAGAWSVPVRGTATQASWAEWKREEGLGRCGAGRMGEGVWAALGR